jgi:hydroxyacyl-ACP dehydratase HTD2-like protein with hotdog domain
MSSVGKNARFSSILLGECLPERVFECGNVQLMMYNAALWNGHRIHYDEPYAKAEEGYPGLVLAGPLLGDWLHQCVEEWLAGDGRIVSINYSNRIAAYVGDILTSGGTVKAVNVERHEYELEVFIKNKDGAVVAPASMVVRFD